MAIWLALAAPAGGVAFFLIALMAILGVDSFGAVPGCLVAPGTRALEAATPVARAEIPPPYLRLYQEAGRALDIDWRFLASIGAQESGHGRSPAIWVVNPSGCTGPMQLGVGGRCGDIVTPYGLDGDSDGRVDPLSPADAIFTAANLLRRAKGAPPAGGSFEGYRQAACGYYGACADRSANYADEVMARAVRYGFPTDGAETPSTPQPSFLAPSVGCIAHQAASASDPTGTRARIVSILGSEATLGLGESGGRNCGPALLRYLGSGCGPEWCGIFAAWVWSQAGVPVDLARDGLASTIAFRRWAERHTRFTLVGATPQPGDIVLYGRDPSWSPHADVIEQVLPDGQIVVVGGNVTSAVRRKPPFHPAARGVMGYAAPVADPPADPSAALAPTATAPGTP